MHKLTVTWFDDEGGESLVDLPAHYKVCPHCGGEGTSSAYLGAFTQEDWENESEEFKEDYIAGRYNKECPRCKGKRVILEIDLSSKSSWTEEQKRAYSCYEERLVFEAEERAILRMEMGYSEY